MTRQREESVPTARVPTGYHRGRGRFRYDSTKQREPPAGRKQKGRDDCELAGPNMGKNGQ